MTNNGNGQGKAVAMFQPPRLPWDQRIEEKFGDIGVTKETWKALVEACFPAAKSIDSVVMALSYCKARRLDPFKRVIHIVPIWDSSKRQYVDTIWPGIAELRTTATRTRQFAGCDAAEFGPLRSRKFEGTSKNGDTITAQVEFPEWAQITVYRLIDGHRLAIAGPRVYWEETYSRIGRTVVPNEMWQTRPRGQLEKCAEAAALRRAFPEELGNEYAAEEMEGKTWHGPTIEHDAPAGVAAQRPVFDAQERVDPETGEVTEEGEAATQPQQASAAAPSEGEGAKEGDAAQAEEGEAIAFVGMDGDEYGFADESEWLGAWETEMRDADAGRRQNMMNANMAVIQKTLSDEAAQAAQEVYNELVQADMKKEKAQPKGGEKEPPKADVDDKGAVALFDDKAEVLVRLADGEKWYYKLQTLFRDCGHDRDKQIKLLLANAPGHAHWQQQMPAAAAKKKAETWKRLADKTQAEAA